MLLDYQNKMVVIEFGVTLLKKRVSIGDTNLDIVSSVDVGEVW